MSLSNIIPAGTRSKIILFALRQDSTGASPGYCKTGLTYQSSGLGIFYTVEGNAGATIGLVAGTPQTYIGDGNGYGFVEAGTGEGIYELCLPDACFSTPGTRVLIKIAATGVIDAFYEFHVSDAVRGVGSPSAIPNVAQGNAGALPTGNAQGVVALPASGSMPETANTNKMAFDPDGGVNYLKTTAYGIMGTLFGGTAAWLAGAFNSFFNQQTPTGTVNSLPAAVPGATSGLLTQGTGSGQINASDGLVPAEVMAVDPSALQNLMGTMDAYRVLVVPLDAAGRAWLNGQFGAGITGSMWCPYYQEENSQPAFLTGQGTGVAIWYDSGADPHVWRMTGAIGMEDGNPGATSTTLEGTYDASGNGNGTYQVFVFPRQTLSGPVNPAVTPNGQVQAVGADGNPLGSAANQSTILGLLQNTGYGLAALETIMNTLVTTAGNLNNLSALANILGPTQIVLPETGTLPFSYILTFKDEEGHLIDPDSGSTVTITATDGSGNSLGSATATCTGGTLGAVTYAGRLSNLVHTGTGWFTFNYTASYNDPSPLAVQFLGVATISTATRKAALGASILDANTITSLASAVSMLTTISGKLPSKVYLAGTVHADGSPDALGPGAATDAHVLAIPTNPLLASDSRLPSSVIAGKADLPADQQTAILTAANAAKASADAAARPGAAMAVADKTGFKLASDGLDAVAVDAPSGPATTLRGMVVQLWRRFFQRAVKTQTAITTYADDGTTVLTTQPISETSTSETQGAAT